MLAGVVGLEEEVTSVSANLGGRSTEGAFVCFTLGGCSLRWSIGSAFGLTALLNMSANWCRALLLAACVAASAANIFGMVQWTKKNSAVAAILVDL
eukprot:3635638-Ditylum_brightwellii.AAC.1